MPRLAINLNKLALTTNILIPILTILFLILGITLSPYFHILTIPLAILLVYNIYLLNFQKQYTILSNFGLIGQLRYILESIGPELRQYFFLNDTEEKPFNRTEREEIYNKSKNEDSTAAFGSQSNFDEHEIKIKHSMYPSENKTKKYEVTFGEERIIKNKYTITKPIMISAMSFGALGEHAVRSLARGAKLANIPINTGEGGYPKYHLMENPDIIFQMGTAKFGIRNPDSSLNDEKLKALAEKPNIKMIEIKLSQGAKPGKGGLLPKEKITKEISELRNVSMNKDVISPAHHIECTNPSTTIQFIKRVQEISQLPVGIKLCLGSEEEFKQLVKEMKQQNTYPDYIALDGSQGGTGAAPKSFMDDIGIPLYPALQTIQRILTEEKVRDKLKIIASGKLINPGKQITALALGADAIYSARGFMLALGCIQALRCNKNDCPVGITTQDKHLQKGLDINEKSQRISNYAKNLGKEFTEILKSTGSSNYKELRNNKLYIPRTDSLAVCE
jgi:glutamate synthase domain-containing protein 2